MALLDTTRRLVRLRAAARRKGFTLIELLVAMALMTILTGSIIFIFLNAQKIFITVDARVQVYQYARYAFDVMERDLANVIRTSDMEFYDDIPPPGGRVGRFDAGEEIPICDAKDPDTFYNHSFTLRQPVMYTHSDANTYRHDSIYFKTVTTLNGQTSAALVEYALVDTTRERPKLAKRLWRVTGIDAANPQRTKFQINGAPGGSARPIVQDLCLYAMDSRFELLVRNRRTDHVGDYYECEELLNPPRAANGNQRVFEPWKNDALQATGAATGDQIVQTYYDAGHDVTRVNADTGVFDPAENGLFRTDGNFTFPMLREGDRIYIWGAGLQPKDYTIDSFRKPDGTLFTKTDVLTDFRIKFRETIEWPTAAAGQRLDVSWDASFLPPAVRCTVRIKDAKSLEYRSIQRVFKILSN